MNRPTRRGAGFVLGACFLLLAGQAGAVPACTAEKFFIRTSPTRSVERVLDDATRDIGALAYEQAEQRLRRHLDELSPGSVGRVWLYDVLGSVYLLQKRNADAEQAYRSALELDLSAGLRHEMQVKLAAALFAERKDDELIGLIEAIEKDECAPVRDGARYWLAAAYAAKGRLVDAERVVPKNFGPESSKLHWKLECALDRTAPCAEKLVTLLPTIAMPPEDAGWCAQLVSSIARAPEAAASLQEARAQGLVDEKGHCVIRTEAGEGLVPVKREAPNYPLRAVRDWLEGFVVVEVTVAPDGSVREARVVEAKPPGVFDDAALEAIRQWRFKPKIVDGKPAESKGLQQLDFRMKR